MTDKPYTPTWDRVREHYYLGRQQFDDPLFPAGGVTEIVAEFDRWHAAEISAAEQRGAVMVMDALKREASDSGWEGIVQPGRSLQELVDHIEHGIRADQEGDHAG